MILCFYRQELETFKENHKIIDVPFSSQPMSETNVGANARMYSLGEVDFIQGMLDFGNPKNSVGLKPNAELRKDAKAPSYNIGTELGIS